MSTQTLDQAIARPQLPDTGTTRKELLENDQVLVIETVYAPGGSVPRHTHRSPHVVYVAEGGTLETTSAEGAVQTLEVHPGQTLWRTPQAHSTRNIGATRVRIAEIEVKQVPGRPALWEKTPPIVTSLDAGWTPDPLDPRRSVSLLVGDPTKPGPYTVRYRAPAGYAIGLHLHPDEDEQLTVLSGSVHWSSGAAGSSAPEYTLTAGGFAPAPARTPHRLWTTEGCIMQVTGVGPRTYVYVNPADDPRAPKG